MDRLNKFKTILWAILGIAGAVAITRFVFGLGAATNLTDNTPWGFWVGFDVMGGVALAGGGFVIAAFHYIFGKKEFHPIVRAAILTAFLGYLAVAIGLLFDLGLPWNIWHAMIYWNPHSPLFEVAWCVMLYLTVLAMEFAPVVLEKYPQFAFLDKLHKLFIKIRIPLVLLGIMLSTLHQSSLGSLVLAMPYKLHPLWYSPMIPITFFISAITLGLMMVTVEGMVTSYLYKRAPEMDIFKKIRTAALVMLGVYGAVKFIDVFVRGAEGFLFTGDAASMLFWAEVAVSIVIPILIFSIPKRKLNAGLLFVGAMSGVIGIVFNRLNVGGLAHINNLTAGDFYFPSWTELAISAGVVSAAMLVFFYFIENYKVWEEQPEDPSKAMGEKPRFSPNQVYLGPGNVANRTVFSLAFVIAFAFSFSFISSSKVHSEGMEDHPSMKARGGDVLFIDGNRDGYGVNFKHKYHEGVLNQNCVSCHHMNKPDDKNTSCYECHSDVYKATNVFNHDWHASSKGANQKCFDCHEHGKFKSKETAKDCKDCHNDLVPKGAPKMKQVMAMSYVDAMHKACIGCHTKSLAADADLKARKPHIVYCSNCHTTGVPDSTKVNMKSVNRWVVVPSVEH